MSSMHLERVSPRSIEPSALVEPEHAPLSDEPIASARDGSLQLGKCFGELAALQLVHHDAWRLPIEPLEHGCRNELSQVLGLEQALAHEVEEMAVSAADGTRF